MTAIQFTLLGTVLFVWLGVLLSDESIVYGVVLATAFTAALLAGFWLATRLPIDEAKWRRTGSELLNTPAVAVTLGVLVLSYAALPIFRTVLAGGSLVETAVLTWTSNGVAERSRALIERSYSTPSGIDALLGGIERQLEGFWYLSLGLFVRHPLLVLAGLLSYAVAQVSGSDGSRTLVAVAVVVPALLWLMNSRRRLAARVAVLAVLGLALVILLDVLVAGRQGKEAEGALAERVYRSISRDFAYGGLALQITPSAGAQDYGGALAYLGRIAAQPIPRVLWPGKSSANPNLELTQSYEAQSVDALGSIRLFTPLGEGLFYLGYVGVVAIPFLYGLTVRLLERIYSTSPLFQGLLAQLWIWAFLGMRLTYFNLFGFVVAANTVVLLALWTLGTYRRAQISRASGRRPFHANAPAVAPERGGRGTA